ncbi:putative ribonuclease H-like domain-containing protein [Tanacetum coccineum]
MGHFARECRAPKNKEGQFRNQDNNKKLGNNEDTSSKAMLSIDGVGTYKRGLATVEEQLITYKKNEFEKVKQEKEGIEFKIEKFDKASKDLDKLLRSQITDKSKKGLGYNVVPPPHPLIYNRPKKLDLSYSDLDEFKEPEFKTYGSEDINTAKVKVNTVRRKAVKTARPISAVVNTVRVNQANAVNTSACWVWRPTKPNSASITLKKHTYIDARGRSNGCSRHMTGNIAYLSDFKEFDRGYVTFGGEAHGGRNFGKGTLKTDSLDFEDVNFVNELKFNLFSVSQMCDKKNHVLFTDIECLILSPNFKNINKLVKDNLVRGLPTKHFENDQTCVACLEGKQHRASCKSKVLNPITKPLFMLHMDLFGPTFALSYNGSKHRAFVVQSLNLITKHLFMASYGFVWSKPLDEKLSEILKNFIKEIENLVDKKVKIIKSNNGTEFKNKVIDDFCREKGIKKEYNVARTPQQNSVAERRNRTLIEAARTILGKFDGKSDEGFFVRCSLSSKAFRVYNTRTRRVEENLHIGFLENKPMIEGNGPKWLFDIDSLTQYMNYVPIAEVLSQNESVLKMLHTLIHLPRLLEMLEPKSATDDQSWWKIGLHNESDELIKKMNRVFWGSSLNSYTVPPISNTRIHKDHPITNVIGDVKSSIQTKRMTKPTSEQGFLSVVYEQKTHDTLNTYLYACFLSHIKPTSIAKAPSDSSWVEAMQEELLQFKLQQVWILVDLPKRKRAIGTKWVFRSRMMKGGIVMGINARLVAQGHRTRRGIDYEEVFGPVARIEAIRLFLAYASFMGFLVYQMDLKSAFLYGTIEEEVYVTQPPGFKDPDHLKKVYKVVKALYGLHQAPRAWYETLANYLLGNRFKRGKIDQPLFIKKQKGDILLVHVYVDDIIFSSTNKELCTEFENLMKDKFQMSSMGELTLFLGLQVQQKEDGIFISQDKYVAEILKKFNYTDVKSVSTPIDLEKPLVKDGDVDDVDVHIYRSMIGSLMYLTSSRPDIIYLKGKPTLGLWYSRDSPFELVTYIDSDYAGATQDRKSTTGGCQFLGNRLISWQCKKQTVVPTSTTKAEYVAATSCCRQVGPDTYDYAFLVVGLVYVVVEYRKCCGFGGVVVRIGVEVGGVFGGWIGRFEGRCKLWEETGWCGVVCRKLGVGLWECVCGVVRRAEMDFRAGIKGVVLLGRWGLLKRVRSIGSKCYVGGYSGFGGCPGGSVDSVGALWTRREGVVGRCRCTWDRSGGGGEGGGAWGDLGVEWEELGLSVLVAGCQLQCVGCWGVVLLPVGLRCGAPSGYGTGLVGLSETSGSWLCSLVVAWVVGDSGERWVPVCVVVGGLGVSGVGFAVPVFSLGDDPIGCLKKAMAFLTAVASSSSGVVNENKGQNYSGHTYKGNATSSRGNAAIWGRRQRNGCVSEYNCQGKGLMARKCTQPKRPQNAAWYKEKASVAEAKDSWTYSG